MLTGTKKVFGNAFVVVLELELGRFRALKGTSVVEWMSFRVVAVSRRGGVCLTVG